MSNYQQFDTSCNVLSMAAPEAEKIIGNLHSLRDQIVTAWGERAIMLTPEEQAEVHAEIRQTCQYLTDLTVLP